MGRLEGVEGWAGGYASANAPSDSPCEWRRQSSGCGVRHLVWVMGGLLQLVSVGIQIGLPPLLARADSQLLGAAFLAALALFQVPAGWLVDRIGPIPVIVGILGISAIVLAVMPDYPIGLPQVLILGIAQAGVAPATAVLLTNWARSPCERDSVLIWKAVGSAGAWLGVWQLLSPSLLLSTGLRSLATAAGISGVAWLLTGASGPTQWGRTPLSWLLPLTVSDLHALPPLNVNEKAAKEKREREHRQNAQLAKQQAGKANAKYSRKMDKRSGDAYNEYKAKADAKKAAAAAAKAEKAAAAGKAAGDRNAGPTTQHRSACPVLLSQTHLTDATRLCPGCVIDPSFSRASGGKSTQQLPDRGAGVDALLRPGGGLGTLALCQLACGATTLAVLPQLQPQAKLQNLAPGLLQQFLLLMVVVAGPIAAAAGAWLKSNSVLRKQSMQSIRRLFGCGALQMQAGVLLAFALLGCSSQQLNEQQEFEAQGVQAAVGVLQACTVVSTTVATNEIVLQTIELAAQKSIAQIGLISGIVHSIGFVPAAVAAGIQVIAVSPIHPLAPAAVSACLCIAGGISFRKVEVSAGNGQRVRTK